MRHLYFPLLVILGLNSQAQWDSCGVTNGLNNPSIEAIDAFLEHQGRLFAHTFLKGMVYSDDYGDNWTSLNTSFTGAPSFIYELDQKLYVSTSVSGAAGGYQYFSTDKGLSWTIDTLGMPGSAVNASYKASVIKAEMLGDYIFYQFNIPNAFQWRHKDSSVYHVDAYANINQMSGWDIANDTLWAVKSGAFEFLTIPKSTYTVPANNNLPLIASSHIYKSGGNIFVAGNDFNLDWVLYRSANSAQSWDTIYLQNLLGTGAFGLKRGVNRIYAIGDKIWLSPTSKGQNTRTEIFFSDDRGNSWTVDSLNLPIDPFGTNAVRVFQEAGGYMFAALNFKDVYKNGQGNIGQTKSPLHKLKVYPNPAHRAFQIESDLDLNSIEILSMGGKLMYRSVAQASYSIADFPSGIYLLKMNTENGVFTEKLMLTH